MTLWTARIGVVVGLSIFVSHDAVAQATAQATAQTTTRTVAPVVQDDQAGHGNRSSTKTSTAQRVSLNVKDSTLAYILRAVARQTNLHISFDRGNPLFAKRMSVRIDRKDIQEAIAEILKGTGLVATMTANKETIVVSGASANDVDMQQQQQQERGSIRISITDSATRQAISGASVLVMDSKISAMTNDQGIAILRDVPTGQRTVSIRLFGYRSVTRSVTVTAERPSSLVVQMTSVPTTLSRVVTTATGQQRSYEVGSDVTRIDVDEVRKYNDITSVADLLANRVPGMFMQSGGGDAGAGNRIRIRGIHSLTLSNDPILIIDGVRVTTIGQEGTGATRTLSSRLDDIDPASIETIEVFKGPSAATLYGPDAANGVIVITKKRGLVGETRWSINANSRLSAIPRKFPGKTVAWAKGLETNDPYPCESNGLTTGGCNDVDSVTVYSPLNDPYYSTMGRGRSSDVGISMQTGTKTSQTALIFRISDELGATQLSAAGRERMRALKGSIPSWARRPNGRQILNGNVNLAMQSIPLFDVGIQASMTHVTLRNNGNGATPGSVGEDTASWLPEQQLLRRNEEATDQYSASLSLSTRQWSWFSWSGTFGVQHGKSARDTWLRAEDCLQADCSNALGTRTKGNLTSASYSVNSSTTVMTPLSTWATLRSSVGLNYNRTSSEIFSVEGRNMPFGVSDPSMAPVKNPESSDTRNATAGVYVQERLSVAQRLFLSGAIRRDAGSGLGSAAKKPMYPKFDLSWIASNDPISILGVGVLKTVRLRTAYGQSGQQPTISDLNATLTRGTAWYDGASHSVYLYNSLGNSLIQAERTKELEFGVDLDLGGRIETVNVTYFRNMTSDAIIPYGTAAESGLPTLSRVENLGKMQNTGFDVSTSLRLVDNSLVSWSLNATYSQTRNKVLSLGRFPKMADGSGEGRAVQRVIVGYPAFGVWMRPIYGYADRDQNGVLSENEYVVGDSLVYVGWSQPKYAVTYRSDISLWRGNLRFGSSFSQDVGLTKQSAIGSSGFAAGDLEGQILSRTFLRGIQKVSSLTWTSGDITVQIPARWLRSVRARSGTMSVSGSNLYQWTNWRGNDANVGSIGSEAYDASLNPTPNTRVWALRMSVTY